jgi:hypothetical protein
MANRRRVPFVPALAALLVVATPVIATTPSGTASGGTVSRADANSANRVIFWSGCRDLLALRDADLERWRAAGVGGFVCGMQRLYGLGGDSRFTTDVDAIPAGRAYDLERALVQKRLVERVHAHGMQLYLGMYLANSTNARTPLAEWFDDAAWRDTVLPAIRDAASAARTLGFDGLAWDLELYPQADGRLTATWDWDYPGNRSDETAVRDQVRRRGREWMEAATAGFPDVPVLAYRSELPNTWDALVQREVNGTERAYSQSTNLDFWDGVTSVAGNWSITFLNAVFYKTTHLDASWDTAYSYELNRLFELFSNELTHWDRVADQIHASPFVWISAGRERFEAARDPDYVAEQLAAARRWGMGRMFANYTDDTLRTFDYRPYLRGLRAAARPGVVDDEPPVLTAEASARSGPSVDLSGTATDNMAVRVVRWRTASGATGAAALRWVSEGGPTSGARWHTEWKATEVPLPDGARSVTVTVEDVKGLTTSRVVTVSR